MSAPAEQTVAPARRARGRGRPLTRWAFAGVVVLSLVVLFSPGSDVPTGLPINDKVVHATLFAALAFTGWWAGVRVRSLVLGLAAYAVGSEILQAVLPIRRDGDYRDALADLLGVALGLVIAVGVRRVHRRRG
jgi:membrane associated rhomboid family serine protease